MENQAICQTRFEDADASIEMLELLHRPKPHATPGRIVVKLTARTIHPLDFFLVQNSYFASLDKPAVIGCEGAGIVEEIGDGVTKVKPGDRVAVWMLLEYMVTGEGSWQEYISAAEDAIFCVPESLSDEDASQMFMNPASVYALMKDVSIPKGEYLLQTAATSVVGRQVIQLAKHQGVKTINIVRRSTVKDELMALGADEVIDSTCEDVVARVRDITGGKLVYAAIDAVGGALAKAVTGSTRNGGLVFEYGSLSGTGEVVVGLEDLRRNVQVKYWSLLNSEDCLSPERLQEFVAEVIKLQQERIITAPPPTKFYPLTEFKQALQQAQKFSGGAKVMLV